MVSLGVVSVSVTTAFFSHATPTTEITPLSLHDALPIFAQRLELDEERLQRRAVGGAEARIGGALVVASEARSEEHTSELQSPCNLVCRLLLEKKNGKPIPSAQQSDQVPRIPSERLQRIG